MKGFILYMYILTPPTRIHCLIRVPFSHGRRVPSKPVQWGKSTMIQAERCLLANLLLNSSNQRFVLLSESCIPLFNFTTAYNCLIDSNLSFKPGEIQTKNVPDSK